MHLPARKGRKILFAVAMIGVGMYVLNHFVRHPMPEEPPLPGVGRLPTPSDK